jgi:hypothetical protein
MGGTERVDSFAMEAIAECLQTAASDIRLVDLNWPEPESDSTTSIDLHAESARLWADSVIERLEVWSKRARQIADALERHQVRRLT